MSSSWPTTLLMALLCLLPLPFTLSCQPHDPALAGLHQANRAAPVSLNRRPANVPYFSGANQYYFFFKGPRMIDDVLKDAKAMGLHVVRTWAFCEGAFHDGFCFQPEPRVYHEPTFRNLDYALHRASQLGIQLVLTLSNNWGGTKNFGGVDQYLRWIGARDHDDFFRSPAARSLYQDYVRQVLTRVNTYNGIRYKDDPTILFWELMNEPRATDKQALYDWIHEMASYVKLLSPNQLVSTGSEGHLASDFYTTHGSPHIDLASIHLYPDHWGASPEQASSYLQGHARAAYRLGKPLYIGEFGLKDRRRRSEVFRRWYAIAERWGVRGSVFWLLNGTQYGDRRTTGTLYPDYDGFGIYYPESGDEVEVIKEFSARMEQRRRLNF